MDRVGQSAPKGPMNFFVYILIAAGIAILVTVVGFHWSSNKREGFGFNDTLATAVRATSVGSGKNGFRDMADTTEEVEGFYAGPAVGAGVPDCLRSSADAAQLSEMLSSRKFVTSEGPDDLRELQAILSKISCFKRDLTGAAGVVEATRYQKFATAHDLEPVAETTARCFAKTIPQRDLALSLDKWGARGTLLIKRLCTSEQLSDAEEERALKLFGLAMGDINDIALGKCCNSAQAVIAGQPQPRMVTGYEPVSNEELRPYKGYY